MLETTNRSVQIGVGWRSKIASNGKFWVTLNKSTQVIGKADFPFGHRTQYPVISSAGALLLNLEELLGLLNSGKERDQRRCKASCSCKGTSKKKEIQRGSPTQPQMSFYLPFPSSRDSNSPSKWSSNSHALLPIEWIVFRLLWIRETKCILGKTLQNICVQSAEQFKAPCSFLL